MPTSRAVNGSPATASSFNVARQGVERSPWPGAASPPARRSHTDSRTSCSTISTCSSPYSRHRSRTHSASTRSRGDPATCGAAVRYACASRARLAGGQREEAALEPRAPSADDRRGKSKDRARGAGAETRPPRDTEDTKGTKDTEGERGRRVPDTVSVLLYDLCVLCAPRGFASRSSASSACARSPWPPARPSVHPGRCRDASPIRRERGSRSACRYLAHPSAGRVTNH